MANKNVLLARVGWMTYYAGPQSGDERPRGGGAYTGKLLGHEAFNFYQSPAAGKTIYGFIQGCVQFSV